MRKTRTIEQTYYLCDNCGKEARLIPCGLCEKHICEKCYKLYPGWLFCNNCAKDSKAIQKYLKTMDIFSDEIHKEVEDKRTQEDE